MDIDEYIDRHISPEPTHLTEVYRRTYLHHLYPRMCSGHSQGRLLKLLTQMVSPQRILELGTFTGYATLCFAEGMPEGCRIHTVEIDDENEEELLATFAATPWADRIHLHIGDAIEVIPTIREKWDLVFIDANKRHYIDYFELVVPRMNPGGYIFADNTLWSGKILDPEANHDPQTRGILEFNELVAVDSRVETVILPIRDGMTILRVKDTMP